MFKNEFVNFPFCEKYESKNITIEKTKETISVDTIRLFYNISYSRYNSQDLSIENKITNKNSNLSNSPTPNRAYNKTTSYVNNKVKSFFSKNYNKNLKRI